MFHPLFLLKEIEKKHQLQKQEIIPEILHQTADTSNQTHIANLTNAMLPRAQKVDVG